MNSSAAGIEPTVANSVSADIRLSRLPVRKVVVGKHRDLIDDVIVCLRPALLSSLWEVALRMPCQGFIHPVVVTAIS